MLMWGLLGEGDAGELILYVEGDGTSQRNRSRGDEVHQAEPSIISGTPLLPAYGTRSQRAKRRLDIQVAEVDTNCPELASQPRTGACP